MQCRQNLYTNRELVGVKKRRLSLSLSTTQGDVVEMSGQRRQIEIESADLRSATGGEIRLRNNLMQRVLPKVAAIEIEISGRRCDEKHRQESCQRPADHRFP